MGAYLARAVELAHQRSIHSVDVYFLEPIPPGPIRIRQTGVREGKYVSHVEMTMFRGELPTSVGRFLLADDEPGRFDAVPVAPTPEKSLEQSVQMPYIEGITPEFTAQFDLRYGEGEFPYSGSSRAVAGGFVRNLHPARGVPALLMHIDAWPPPILALTDSPAAASSVRWHVQFHADVHDADGQQWSWLRNESVWRTGRLATVTGTLVRGGRCVAYCEQTQAMYI